MTCYYKLGAECKEKTCSRCRKPKLVDDFRVRKFEGRLIRVASCRECEKAYRDSRPEEMKSRHKEIRREFFKRNKARYLEYFRQWRRSNKESYVGIYTRANSKIRLSPQKRLRGRLAKSIRKSLLNKKASNTWLACLNYTPADLAKHLETLFTSEMSWSNYGKLWSIDHVVPNAFFSYSRPDDVEFKMCWDLENLRPLRVTENSSKGCKITKEGLEKLKQLSAKYNYNKELHHGS